MKNNFLKEITNKLAGNFQTYLISILIPLTLAFFSKIEAFELSAKFILTALVIISSLWILSEYIVWRKEEEQEEKVKKINLNDNLKAFRFQPYSENDHDIYFRPDEMQKKALEWIASANENILYLTGASGAGKTSLLRAWLAPELPKSLPESEIWIFDNLDNLERHAQEREAADISMSAVSRLRHFIRRQFDEIAPEGDSPEKPGSIRDMLEQAVRRIPGKLIVAIDQFGSSLMVRDREERENFAALFDDLTASPIEGLVLLLVMRSDRTDLSNLTLFNLPSTTIPGNRFEIRGLYDHESLTLLERLAPDLSDDQRQRILNEAKEIDAGVVRPVTLNIAGKALQSVGENLPQGTLIERYLSQLLTRPGYDDTVPNLLQAMITRQGRTRHVTIGGLATQIETTPDRVLSFLRSLEKDGLVRSLDRPRDETWEIAHSFLAEQLDRLMPRLRPNRLAKMKRNMMLVAAGTIATALVFLGMSYKQSSEIKNNEIITDEGNGTYAVLIDRDEELALLDEVRDIKGITSLTISDMEEMSSIPQLEDFDDLTELTIKWNEKLDDLGNLEDLTNLRKLTISDNPQLDTLPSLDHFSNLESLDISNNARLSDIPPLKSLEKLKILKVRYNELLTGMPDLAGNPALEELSIMNNKNLQEIPSLGDVRRLREIALGRSVDSLDADDPWFDRTLELLTGASTRTNILAPRDSLRQNWEEKLNERRRENGLEPIEVQPW